MKAASLNGEQRTFAVDSVPVDSVPVLLALASILFLLMSDQPLRFRLDFTDHQHTGNTFVQVSSVAAITLVTYELSHIRYFISCVLPLSLSN